MKITTNLADRPLYIAFGFNVVLYLDAIDMGRYTSAMIMACFVAGALGLYARLIRRHIKRNIARQVKDKLRGYA